MTATLAELAEKLSKLRDKMDERKKVIKEMERIEEELETRIINYMGATRQKTTSLEGIGRITVGTRGHARIVDKEQLARFVLMRGAKALKNGDPVADSVAVLQQRAAMKNIESFVEQGYTLEEMGVEIVDKPSLTFTRV